MGYCGKLSVVRERGLAAVSTGGKGRVSVLDNEVNTAGVLLNKSERSTDKSTFFEMHGK